MYFDFFSSQGEKGPGGLPGHPGEEGEHVSTKSYFFLWQSMVKWVKY